MPPNSKGKKEVVIVEQNKRLNLLMFLYLKCMPLTVRVTEALFVTWDKDYGQQKKKTHTDTF